VSECVCVCVSQKTYNLAKFRATQALSLQNKAIVQVAVGAGCVSQVVVVVHKINFLDRMLLLPNFFELLLDSRLITAVPRELAFLFVGWCTVYAQSSEFFGVHFFCFQAAQNFLRSFCFEIAKSTLRAREKLTVFYAFRIFSV